MKRTVIFLAIAVFALGGATAAWAQTSGERGAKREAAHACLDEAKAAHPDAPKAELREAVKSCLAEQGITRPPRGERRAQFRECVRQARADHSGDRPAIREAVKECMGRN